jgi:glutaredoxin 3
VAFREIDVTGNADVRQHMTERAQGHNTLPQIFIGAKHVGGCDELYALDDAGELDALLQSAERPA